MEGETSSSFILFQINNMHIMNYLRLLLCCMVMIGCNHQSKNYSNDIVHVIEINDKNEMIRPFELTDIFEKIELIPLETSKHAILGSPGKLIVKDSLFYIHNSQQNGVSVFDKNGSLVFSSKEFQGRGPKEHISCGNFTINQNTGNILIMDQVRSKIVEYNLTDGFLRNVDYPKSIIRITDFEMLKDDVYIFYSSDGFKSYNADKKNNTILIFDSKSNKVIGEIAPSPDNRIEIISKSTCFYHLNDTLHFNYLFPSLDTYFIDSKKYRLIKKYRYDFGQLNLDSHNVLRMLENARFIFLNYSDKIDNIDNIAVYDKANKLVSIKQNISGSKGQMPPPDAIDNNCLYYMCRPEYINYLTSPDLLTESAKKQLEDIKDVDNYILIKYVLKK